MPFTEFETARIEAARSDFMAKRRPPPEIRDKLDLAYRIEGQSVVIFEIRPFWRDPSETIEGPPPRPPTRARPTAGRSTGIVRT